MLRRFASAAVVAGILIALAAAFIFFIPAITLQKAAPVLMLWCLAPALWGFWAMLAPSTWVPSGYPLWGTLLGAVAGTLGMVMLNLPKAIFGLEFSLTARWGSVLLVCAFYYVAWSFVAAVYQKLSPRPFAASLRSSVRAA